MEDFEKHCFENTEAITISLCQSDFRMNLISILEILREPGISFKLIANSEGGRFLSINYYPSLSASEISDFLKITGKAKEKYPSPRNNWLTFCVKISTPMQHFGSDHPFGTLVERFRLLPRSGFLAKMQEISLKHGFPFLIEFEFSKPDHKYLIPILNKIDYKLSSKMEHPHHVITDLLPDHRDLLTLLLGMSWTCILRISIPEEAESYIPLLARQISHNVDYELESQEAKSPSAVIHSLVSENFIRGVLGALDYDKESPAFKLSRLGIVYPPNDSSGIGHKKTKCKAVSKSFALGKSDDFIVCLPEEIRSRHLYTIGSTGSGKSTLLLRLALHDIESGKKVLFLDPHGETARLLLENIPPSHKKLVEFLDFGDKEHPISLDILRCGAGEDGREMTILNLLSIVRSYWTEDPDIVGPVFQTYFTRGLELLIAGRESGKEVHLDNFQKLFLDKSFLRELLVSCEDNLSDESREYWENYIDNFDNYKEKLELANHVASKINAFTSTKHARTILGTGGREFDYHSFTDPDGSVKSLVVSLNSAKVGEATANFVGQYLLFNIRQSIMSQDPKECIPISIFMDELQYWIAQNEYSTTDEVEKFLSECRKFKISLAMANQYFGQLTKSVVYALLANIGIWVIFRPSIIDADTLLNLVGEKLTKDLISFPNYQAAVLFMSPETPFFPLVVRTFPFERKR